MYLYDGGLDLFAKKVLVVFGCEYNWEYKSYSDLESETGRNMKLWAYEMGVLYFGLYK